MGIDDSRRPQPADPQPAPVGSDDGLTGNEVGRPPAPGEVGEDGRGGGEHQRAGDVDGDPAAP